nr:immunoglobulin heavy chain junction region [Macaca mulatta]MOW45448.1 immunoglobulin heavy chain junction region [Macaca mulatta]MOW45475.1 immunoglobulin heavy chain junction region [Macaca mulatta]MOW45480.1 immunoglobulin heavy chain junction region [Macaca mulatta]MOW45505.1 immunoglobulin heavy chain junction region [Macaca mulatta]
CVRDAWGRGLDSW